MKWLLTLLLSFLIVFLLSAQDLPVAHQWDERYPLKHHPSKVKRLDARQAQNLDSLIESLPQFTGLTSLNLWGLGLDSLPDDIFSNMPNLVWLDLGKNKLKEVPKSLEELSFLNYLGFCENQLEQLPQCIQELPLNDLRISGNNLTGTFVISSEWKEMTYLNISHNQFDKIEGLYHLKKLERLALTHCQFTDLPDQFQKCKKLKSIYLDDNPLESLPHSLLNRWRISYIVIENTRLSDEAIRNYRMKYPNKTFDTCQTC